MACCDRKENSLHKRHENNEEGSSTEVHMRLTYTCPEKLTEAQPVCLSNQRALSTVCHHM